MAKVRGAGRGGWWLLGAAAWLCGCGDPVERAQETTPVALTLSPETTLLATGEVRTLVALGVDEDGALRPVTASWEVVDPGVLSLEGPGELRGAQVGLTEVVARVGALEASAVVEVVPEPVIALGLTPATPRVRPGERVHLTVTATFADDSSRYVTQRVVWAVEPPERLAINQGTVTGLEPGVARVTARIGEVTSHIDVTVDPL